MVYITNITKNINVGIAGRTLKPGQGDEFEDAVAEVYGVVAAEKKGLISIEMVKSVPGGVATPVKQEEKPVKPKPEGDSNKPPEDEPEDEPGGDPEIDDKSKTGDGHESRADDGSNVKTEGAAGDNKKAQKVKKQAERGNKNK